MKKDNHLDPELFDLFVRSGVYRTYGKQYLPDHLIDEVDEEHLLSIEPKAFELPERAERMERWEDFSSSIEVRVDPSSPRRWDPVRRLSSVSRTASAMALSRRIRAISPSSWVKMASNSVTAPLRNLRECAQAHWIE